MKPLSLDVWSMGKTSGEVSPAWLEPCNKHKHYESKHSLPDYQTPPITGVDTNFEKLETMGLATHNFQRPQVKCRSPNLFLQFDLHHQEKAAGVL